MFQWIFKWVTSLLGVWGKFQRCYKNVSRKYKYVLRKIEGWWHHTALKDKLELIRSISQVGGWVWGRVDGWSNVIIDPTLAFIRAQIGFRIQVWAEFVNIQFLLQKNILRKGIRIWKWKIGKWYSYILLVPCINLRIIKSSLWCQMYPNE